MINMVKLNITYQSMWAQSCAFFSSQFIVQPHGFRPNT